MRMDISVIVPVYYGKKFIQNLIRQIEQCSLQLPDVQTELLLINDAPDDRLPEYISPFIPVHVHNTDRNRGIQGARIKGVELSSGTAVLMLDQDDRIAPSCLREQWEILQATGADAVVCRARNVGRAVYNRNNPFEAVSSLEYMLSVGNPIVSPGQVLIHRTAIPEIWKKHVLRHGGADDWFLWICMLKEKKVFARNEAVLFEHVVGNQNKSWDTVGMLASEQDVCAAVKEAGLLTREEELYLERTVAHQAGAHIHMLEKFRKMFFVYDRWLRLKQEGKRISGYLADNGWWNIAIYGMGYIGKRLAGELQNSVISIAYVIDRNAGYMDTEFPMCTMDGPLAPVDAAIITLVEQAGPVRDRLEKELGVPVFTMEELLENLETAGSVCQQDAAKKVGGK